MLQFRCHLQAMQVGLEAVELPRLNQLGLGFNSDQSPELDLESLLQLTQASQ